MVRKKRKKSVLRSQRNRNDQSSRRKRSSPSKDDNLANPVAEQSHVLSWVALGTIVILYLVEVFHSAWACDDAYITYRTIDNFVNGLGLTWNPGFRVQTYTHPLWMFLGSAVYFFSHDAFFTMLALCIAFSMLTALTVPLIAGAPAIGLLAILVLALSKSFVDYSTSGLENPLSHFLIAIFFWVYFRKPNMTKRTVILSLIAAFILTNRLDLGLVILPALIFHVVRQRSKQAYLDAAFGLAPIAIWMLFSLVYYGFFFPNTAAAKLNTGLDKLDLWRQGLAYVKSTFIIDPLTALTILLGMILPVWWSRSLKHTMFSLGILLYVLYVVSFGGDFMAGRFFSVPLLSSVCILSCTTPKLPNGGIALICVAILLLGIYPERSPLRFLEKLERLNDHDKIEDERAFYMACASLRALDDKREIPDCLLAKKGRKARTYAKKIVIKGSVGFYGFFAGPNIHIIDRFALADPLLARLPMAQYDNWRIGHFRRNIPDGYVQSLLSGENRFKNIHLGEYYQRLKTVIYGNLWSSERMWEIVRFNTGQNDYLLTE